MKYTNNTGLPLFVHNALTADTYDKVGDISVTSLIKSPRQVQLLNRHDDEIEQDVADLAFMALGTGVHHMMETADFTDKDRRSLETKSKWMIERRLVHKVDGVELSGKADLVNIKNGTIYDYKVCSVWTHILGGHADWIRQMNTYRWLMKQCLDIDISSLSIIAIYRDWKKGEQERDLAKNPFDPQYPHSPIMEVPVSVLPFTDVEAQIKRRIALHADAETASDADLPKCTPDERWARGEAYAVKKKGQKRAMPGGLQETRADAVRFANKQSCLTEIEHRPAKNIKCQSYCLGAPWCNQWAELQKAKTGIVG